MHSAVPPRADAPTGSSRKGGRAGKTTTNSRARQTPHLRRHALLPREAQPRPTPTPRRAAAARAGERETHHEQSCARRSIRVATLASGAKRSPPHQRPDRRQPRGRAGQTQSTVACPRPHHRQPCIPAREAWLLPLDRAPSHRRLPHILRRSLSRTPFSLRERARGKGPTITSDDIQLHRGLNGVYFDRTRTTFIDGREGKLLYRGYSIHDLAEHSTFEETAYLLLHGELPARAQLDAFDAELKGARELPAPVLDVIRSVQQAHPMDVLRTAVSALAAFDPEVEDNSPEATLRKGVRLTSQVATVVTAHHHLRNGRDPVAPGPSLSHAANFLYMLQGEEPSEDAAALMDKDFVLHADHGSNASAFTARVVAGTQANLHAAVVAGIAALSGPAHGGAAENVMKMALEIGEPERAAAYVAGLRARREPVIGFGHRVYRAEDPRARHMREGVQRLSQEMGEPKWYQILEAVVEAMRPYARRGVYVNVDFYAGVVYYLHGIPEDLFRPHLRPRPRPRLDRAGAGAVRAQHPDPPPAQVRGRSGAPLRPDRGAVVTNVITALSGMAQHFEKCRRADGRRERQAWATRGRPRPEA